MLSLTIVISGAPTWAAELEAQLGGAYRLLRYATRERYIPRLADDHAVLILVDGARDDWQQWVTAPKVNNATRRIPLMFISANNQQHPDALLAGANLALSPAELLQEGARLLADYARAPDAAMLEQLDCECRDALPPLAQQGVERFNASEYYAQHDLFEEQWVATEGPVRDLYRAVLQVGVAYYQIRRGNQRGALKMLLRSVQWLALLPDVCQGIDVKQLRADSARVRAALEALPPEQIERFDHALLKPVRLVER